MLKDLNKQDSIRFTANEVAKFKQVSLDLSNVKSKEHLTAAEIQWIKQVAEINPKILEALLERAAESDPAYKPPAKLSLV